MKRDLELVRAILFAMEAHPFGFAPHPFTVAGYDKDVIEHHVWLMTDGKLVTSVHTTAYGGPGPAAVPLTITWTGHEFLDAVRSDKVWLKVKTELKDRGLSVPFSLLQDLALKIAASYLGLP